MSQKQVIIKDLQPNHYYPAQTWYNYTYKTLQHSIDNLYECRATTNQVLAHCLGYNSNHHLLNTPLKASKKTIQKIHTALQRLGQQEPLQYITGHISFLDHSFKINQGVFIPRSETEEMVHYIIQQQHLAKNILDLCTGNGCIAISLKKIYKKAQLYALDIDPKALKIAYKNAKQFNVKINWIKLNLLQDSLPAKQWDLIVSNPPYIPLAEKKELKPKILHYEPHQALFVPDKNPLIFYKRIAQLTKQHLAPKGYLYVEIHENLSKQTAKILQTSGLKKVKIHKDLNGKNRWITCHKQH